MFRNHINRFKQRSRTRILLSSIVLLCFLSACYDDTFDSFRFDEGDSPYINFKIIDESSAATSRSDAANNENVTNVYTLTSKEDEDPLYIIESEADGINIRQKSSPRTRGEAANDSTILETLGIYAFRSTDGGTIPAPDTELKFDNWTLRNDYVYNGISFPSLFDLNGLPHDEEPWPAYSLDFVAYYPYTPAFHFVASGKDNPDTGDSNSAAQNEYNNYMDYLYSWVWAPGKDGLRMHPTPRNGMYLYYKVPEKVENQVDLMACYVRNQRKSPVQLNMRHLLTAIRFEAGDSLSVCTIKKIALQNVRNSGYLSVMNLAQDNDTKLWWATSKVEDTDNEFVRKMKNKSAELVSYDFEPGDGSGFALPQAKLIPK